MARTIDLNADLGEGYGRWTLGDDQSLLGVVTSANVACGFHAGDPSIMAAVCRSAAERGVAIGAQVGYPDLAGFGRRFIDIDPIELRDGVLYQLGALHAFAAAAGSTVAYVKPHGALYNAIVHHHDQAAAVVDAVATFGPGSPILGLPGSVVLELAAARGLRAVTEAFADRAYRADGTLVPRTEQGAVIHDPDQIVERVSRLVERGEIVAIDATVVELVAESICVHGDTPGAVAIARAVHESLVVAGFEVSAFTR